mmetsp:Transcript_26623/g.54092  ORF Transcript_26623/g.54092 Transcript_26623/m.54092 type:complete len:350 (-) Transcript_26623:35-1084(-)
MSEEPAASKRQPLDLVSSPMPLLPITSQQTIDLCASLPLRPTDVFICSYPKSGTTWTQHIVLSLLVKSASKKAGNSSKEAATRRLQYNHVSDYAPFYEVDQHWNAKDMNLVETVRENHDKLGRRVFNTHLRWDMLPATMEDDKSSSYSAAGGRKKKAKFIYLIRSPMDVCLSFYCHLSNQNEGGYHGSYEDFFNEWIEGKIAFGSYIDHILSFAPAFVDAGRWREILLVSYEDMISDLPAVVAKIASFIEVDVTKEELEELLPTFTFRHMKSDLKRFQPRSVTWKNDFKFLRRGVSGDSLTVATDAQRKVLSAWLQREGFIEKLQSVLSGTDSEVLNKILSVCCATTST